MRGRIFLIIILVSSIVPGIGGVRARTIHDIEGEGNVGAFRMRIMDVNRARFPLTNWSPIGGGRWVQDEWPVGTGDEYIYWIGLWVGTKLRGKPLVSCGYDFQGGPRNSDFVPGPPEHADDYEREGYGAHPEDSIFVKSECENPEEWPVKDENGNPIFIGEEDMWCEYNDLCEPHHEWERGGKPLGLHIQQRVFGWSSELYQDMIFVEYVIKNVSEEKLTDLYIGFACDMDVGGDVGYALNYVGCDITRSLGYTYLIEIRGMREPPPYYIGVRLLRGPRADDTVYVPRAPTSPSDMEYVKEYMDTILPGERLPLTAFNKCTLTRDAKNELQRWQMLAGYDIESGEFKPWNIWDAIPEDKRMVLSSGPFDLESGEVDTFVVAFMYANGSTGVEGDTLGTLEDLKNKSDVIKMIYENFWQVAGPPPSPKLVAIPGDRKVTLIWDDSPLKARDGYIECMKKLGDTVYREYDFEGFRLWKSLDNTNWDLLGQWDLKNDIVLLPGGIMYCGEKDTIIRGEKSDNKGLQFSFVDTDVFNGVDYYYSVTSYDFNTRGVVINEKDVWVSSESGKKGVLVRPRSEVSNYKEPEGDITTTPNTGKTNTCKIEANIIGEAEVRDRKYRLVCTGVRSREDNKLLPVYQFDLYRVEGEKRRKVNYSSIEAVMRDSSFSIVEHIGKKDTVWDTVSVSPTIVILLRKIKVDTQKVKVESLRVGNIEKRTFDGIVLSGKVEIPLNKVIILTSYTRVDSIVVEKDLIGKWDTTYHRDSVRIIEVDSFPVVSEEYFIRPDTIIVTKETGAHIYRDSILKVQGFFSGGVTNASWAYNGGEVEIRWKGDDDSLTLEVIDLTTGLEIPYKQEFGDNWCFCRYLSIPYEKPYWKEEAVKDTPQVRMFLYVSGVVYKFNRRGMSFNWETERPDPGDVWKVVNRCKIKPPVRGVEFEFTSKGLQYTENYDLSKVRVVPNPYLVRAMWDRSKDIRKIEFTNLPSRCVIRIYTLDGVLIRKLEHNVEDGYKTYVGGTKSWDLLTENEQLVASGVYLYHIEVLDKNGTPNPKIKPKIGKIAIIMGKK